MTAPVASGVGSPTAAAAPGWTAECGSVPGGLAPAPTALKARQLIFRKRSGNKSIRETYAHVHMGLH